MRTLLIILLLPVMAWAGSETLRPDGDAAIGAGWGACGATFYECVSDQVDANYDSMYDNNNVGSIMFFSMANTAVADSTIDSVTIYVKWRTDHVGIQFSIVDSIDGDAVRESSPFTAALVGTFYIDSITYTLAPDSEPYIWDDIDKYILGIKDYAHANNKQSDFTELWITSWYSYASAGGDISYVRRRKLSVED
jgi:hypothetical protein